MLDPHSIAICVAVLGAGLCIGWLVAKLEDRHNAPPKPREPDRFKRRDWSPEDDIEHAIAAPLTRMGHHSRVGAS
jgi:hypothetical protein